MTPPPPLGLASLWLIVVCVLVGVRGGDFSSMFFILWVSGSMERLLSAKARRRPHQVSHWQMWNDLFVCSCGATRMQPRPIAAWLERSLQISAKTEQETLLPERTIRRCGKCVTDSG
jgi:hypothetical protein